VDGNAAKVSTIETAMEEAALIWPSTPEAHIGVSIGVGRSQNRTTPWWFSRVALHSWEDRDVDQYEEDLDPHEAWDKHYRTLSRSQRSRLRRLDVDFQQEALPSVVASNEVERMIHATTEYFAAGEPHRELRNTAEALLAAVFYLASVKTTSAYFETCTMFTIACQLAEEHQEALFDRLEASNCVFVVEGGRERSEVQLKRPEYNQPFEQDFPWLAEYTVAGETRFFLAFPRADGGEDEIKAEEEAPGKSAPARKYHINGSPWSS